MTSSTRDSGLPNKHPEHSSERDRALSHIADTLRWWLRHNESGFDDAPSDDTHVIPPCWPTRGQLKAWAFLLDGNGGSNA